MTASSIKSCRLDELTTYQITSLLEDNSKKNGIILPVGSIEQHGPFLPLGCDTTIARGAAEHLSLALGNHNQFRALVLPDFTYSPSPGAEHIHGTISVEFDWMGQGLTEVIQGALKTPWDFVAIVNAHAHNHGRVIENSIAGSIGRFGRKVPVVIINIYEFAYYCDNLGMNAGKHAGEFEIALYSYYSNQTIQAYRPVSNKNPRERPYRIYGLDLLPRSIEGMICDDIPDIDHALKKSSLLGKQVDKAIYKLLISDLEIYYRSWQNA